MTTFDFPRYTYNDYKNWKEDWELVNGYPLQMLPSASFKHSKVLGNLIYQSNLSLKKNDDNCNCSVFPELDWKINEDTVIRPDIMVVCGDPKNDFLEMPPILIIEILSPSNIKTDRVIKFELYQENGVQFYLMVDPLKDKVEVFELIDNKYKQVEKHNFKIDKNCEIEFDFEKLWS
jgi:Uma2 family endonuclease